ncbi:MAG: substrate-binding domain-containing protein [Bacteroidota bacterium]
MAGHQHKKVILFLETSREFGRRLTYGITRYARLNGPWSIFQVPRDDKSPFPRLERWQVDGIVTGYFRNRRPPIDPKIPAILVIGEAGWPEDVPSIVTDGKSIAYSAGEHLLTQGLRNFAFCGYEKYIWSNDRETHFRNYLRDAGFQTHIYHRWKARRTSWYEESTLMQEWISRLPKPVGIMACNDDLGQRVLEACKTLGVMVPEDVAVIGVDNDPFVCELADPPLSSIALNTERAGYNAAALLDEMMRGRPMKGQQIVVTATHVVQRQSTSLLAVQDKEVVEGILFIRRNAKRKLPVSEIVAQTGLSRRTLESRFRNALHRSIQQEVRRVRVEMIAQLLVETDIPIAKITETFTFTDAEHLSRYFRKEKGVGLLEFRKLHQRTSG